MCISGKLTVEKRLSTMAGDKVAGLTIVHNFQLTFHLPCPFSIIKSDFKFVTPRISIKSLVCSPARSAVEKFPSKHVVNIFLV